MSEKPFWEGKTCEEMAGLPVKAVFKNGVTITGQLGRFGGIPISTEGMNSPISISSNTLNFRPHREISSVELLDSLEYERIDNIEDVREGDIFVAKDLNRYSVCSVLRKEHGEDNIMSDYKQRMIREHRELQERISKLAHMLEGYAEGTLDFTPACSFQLLESQLYAMGTYANILQERARIEQVDLNAPLEGGESGEVPQD